jgi:hypothetical protein
MQQPNIFGPILGLYKSLTDTCMQELGLRRRNSFPGKHKLHFRYSAMCDYAISDMEITILHTVSAHAHPMENNLGKGPGIKRSHNVDNSLEGNF